MASRRFARATVLGSSGIQFECRGRGLLQDGHVELACGFGRRSEGCHPHHGEHGHRQMHGRRIEKKRRHAGAHRDSCRQNRSHDGSQRVAEHILLGTGYSVDISRYRFLSPELVKQLDLMDGYPRLTTGFRSSVPGLYFIGATAARSFGPLLYFVAGTEFASKELSLHLGRNKVTRR